VIKINIKRKGIISLFIAAFMVINLLPCYTSAEGSFGWGDSLSGTKQVGTWTIAGEGELKANGKGTGWNEKFQIFKGAALENYTLKADMRWLGSGTTDAWPKYGMYAAYKDDNNWVMYYMDVNAPSPRICTHAKVNGQYFDWQNSEFLPAGTKMTDFHTFKVEKAGSNFKFYVDNLLMQERDFNIGSAQYGLILLDTDAEFNNITVEDKVYRVSMDKNNLILSQGEKYTLKAAVEIIPSQAADQKLTWSSSNENVAVVSQAGEVTAVAPGNAVITASSDTYNVKNTCSVSVKDPSSDPNTWGNSASSTPKSGIWVMGEGSLISSTELGTGYKHIFKGDVSNENYTVSADIKWKESGTEESYPKYGLYASYFDKNNFVSVFFDKSFNELCVNAVISGKDLGWPTAALPDAFDFRIYHNLRVDKVGNNFKFYVDGKLTMERDYNISNGQIGLITVDTKTDFRNVSLDAYGWGVSASGKPVEGKWLPKSSSEISGLTAGPGWMQIFNGDLERNDYTVEAEARQVAVGGTQAFPKYGIYACFKDKDNFVTAWLDPKYEGFVTFARVNGQDQQWINADLKNTGFKYSDFNKIKVEKIGSTFKFYLNGVLKLTRNFNISNGQIGVISEDVKTEYKNIKVYGTNAIKLNLESSKVEKGKSLTLVPSISGLSEDSYPKLQWKSSNPAVASVGEDGVVTALEEGIALITASSPALDKAVCTITVTHESLPEGKFMNPIKFRGEDPWVIFNPEDKYYYFIYAYNGATEFRIAKSKDLTEIGQEPGQVVWKGMPGTWNERDAWAPELHNLNGKWYIYYCADDGNNANHRMGVLEADKPMGPYVDKGMIKAPFDKWAIDGTPLQTEDGKLYMVWSGWPDGVPADSQQNLFIAPMSDPFTISGDRVSLSAPTEEWERRGRGINEGPQVLRKDGKLMIVYSASASWTNDYCLGLLTFKGGDVMNPDSWAKSGPVFAKAPDKGVYGVGHASFVKSPDLTEDWIVYHAQITRTSGWGRDIRAQRFTWNADGTPNFGEPVRPEVLLDKPSANKFLKTAALTADKQELQRKGTAKLSLTAALTDGSELDLSLAKVQYFSSDPSVVRVEGGVATAHNTGSAEIYAEVTFNGITVITNKVTIKVTTSPEAILSLIKTYEASRELVKPLSAQLENSLKEAVDHFDKGRKEQGIKHLEDFLKHLANPAMSKFIKENAKSVLKADAEALIELWK
jgi:GH43 family beta-xylosidase/uncharacterized protein YjdB